MIAYRPTIPTAACASGTDRVAELAATLGLSDEDVVINVQGDEPAVHPRALATLALAFEEPSVEMATLVRSLKEDEHWLIWETQDDSHRTYAAPVIRGRKSDSKKSAFS